MDVNALGKALADQLSGAFSDSGDTFNDRIAEKWLAVRGISVRWNVITGYAETDRAGGMQILHKRMWVDCADQYKSVTENKVKAVLDLIAHRNSYNPYLEMIPEWDGTDYFKQIVSIINSDQPIVGLWEWLLSVVGMQMLRERLEKDMDVWRPQMLLLVSAGQGRGKDWFFRGLSLGHYYEFDWEEVLRNDRDALRRMKRCVVAHVAEDPTGHGKSQESIKKFLTMTTIKTRGIHEKYDDDDDAILSAYGGSTNDMSPLRDPTGSRRYCVVNFDKKKRVPTYNFVGLLSQVKHAMQEWIDNTPTRRYPWLRHDYTENDKRNAMFVAIPDIWADQLRLAFKEAPDKTLECIRDSIASPEALRFYCQGKNLYYGLQRIGCIYDGKVFKMKEDFDAKEKPKT